MLHGILAPHYFLDTRFQMFVSCQRTNQYKPGLAWFCAVPLVVAVALLYAGGFTTSIEAGMAFLDWPLSNGTLNPEGWLEDRDMRAEHSHRLLGMVVGLLTIIMVFWTWRSEERAWLRRLTVLCLAAVILQGIMGGMRVRFDQLNTGAENNLTAQAFVLLHAMGAQIVLCLLVSIALAQSRNWIERAAGLSEPAGLSIRYLGIGTCLLLLLQILLGAIVRHGNAGLALVSFPQSTPNGDWLPTYWNWAVAVNFTHRAGALLVCLAVLAFVAQVWADKNTRQAFGPVALLPLLLLVVQIFLGATLVWTRLNEHSATLHTLTGAFLLASCWMLTFLSFRLPLRGFPPESLAENDPNHSNDPAPASA